MNEAQNDPAKEKKPVPLNLVIRDPSSVRGPTSTSIYRNRRVLGDAEEGK